MVSRPAGKLVLSESGTIERTRCSRESRFTRNRGPLQLVLDEADAFAPQRPQKGQERMLDAVEDLVRRGRRVASV
jgi:hypothetical protein